MSESIKKFLVEYSEKRSRAEAKRDMRIVRIYEEYPEIKEIDEELYKSGAENVKKIIGDLKNTDKYNNEYRNHCAELKERRARIITENGIDPKFDRPEYECEKCGDTGFCGDGNRCVCFEKLLKRERYLRSNLTERLEKENYDTFSFDFYSREKDEKHSLSPYDNMVKIHKSSVNFCDNFNEPAVKNLLFHGATGLGKTFLSSCIAKRLIDGGKSVIYLRAPRLFSIYEENRFSLGEAEPVSSIYDCDLLIIDDLGTEAQNKNNLAFLFDLLNDRLEKDKKIIISTNFSLGEITKIYSSRFTSRIYEKFAVYDFYGDDIRIKKIRTGTK